MELATKWPYLEKEKSEIRGCSKISKKQNKRSKFVGEHISNGLEVQIHIIYPFFKKGFKKRKQMYIIPNKYNSEIRINIDIVV